MIDLNRISKCDPVNREAYKQTEETELSPMDPPDAYAPPASINQRPYELLPPLIQKLMDEHKFCLAELDRFEQVLLSLRNGAEPDQKIFNELSTFFRFFDDEIAPHNKKEEKTFFPLLHQRLIAKGEHCHGHGDTSTAVDVLESDHTEFVQFAALSFNFFGLATRLPDPRSRAMVLDAAIEQGKLLVEKLKLHIFREDHIVFQLAADLISEDEFMGMTGVEGFGV